MSFQDPGLLNPNPTPTQPQQPQSGPGETAPPPQLVTPPPQPQPQPPPDQPPPGQTGYMANLGPSVDTGGPPPGDTGDQADMPGWWRQQPQPPSLFMPYAPNRGPGGWGKPWWPITGAQNYPGVDGGPYMPSPWESYGVIAGSGAQLSRWGSAGVAPFAGQAAMIARQYAPILDMISKGAFSRNFNAAQLQGLRLQQEQMYQASEQAYRRHQYEASEYGKILEEAKLHAISPDEATQQLRALTYQYGDDALRTVLDNKGLGAAEKFIDYTDAKARDMYAGTVSGRKATGGEDPRETLKALGEGDTVSEGLPTKQAPWEEAAAGAPAGKAPAGPETPAADFNDQIKKQYGLTDQELEMARGNADGDPSDLYGDLGKAKDPRIAHAKSKIDQAADAIRNRINQTARDRNKSQDDRLDDIEHIAPGTAGKLRGLLNLGLDPERDIPAQHHERERLTTLATSINPHWKTSSFGLAKQYEELNKPSVRTVQRVGAFLPAVNSLNSALLRIPEDVKIAPNVLKEVYANKWSGDPTYTEIYTAIQNVINETSAIQSGTGQSRVTNVKMRAQEMLNTMSPAQIRTQLLLDAKAAYGMVKNIETQYRTTVGDPNAQLPFFPKTLGDDFRTIMRMNPYTGETPEDASGNIKATSRKFDPKAGNVPSWLKTDPNDPNYNAWKPLTAKQVLKARYQIRQNENSTDPKVQATVARLRRILGDSFGSPEMGDPDYENPNYAPPD